MLNTIIMLWLCNRLKITPNYTFELVEPFIHTQIVKWGGIDVYPTVGKVSRQGYQFFKMQAIVWSLFGPKELIFFRKVSHIIPSGFLVRFINPLDQDFIVIFSQETMISHCSRCVVDFCETSQNWTNQNSLSVSPIFFNEVK